MNASPSAPDGPPTPSLRRVRTSARRLALTCALILMCAASRAGAQPVRVGVRGGPTFGFLNDSAIPFVSAAGDTEANTNVRIDVHAGAFAVIPLANRLGLQVELLYVRNGAHFSRFGEDNFRAEQYQLAYVQGQVLGRRDVVVSRPLRLYALAGITLKRLVRGIAHRTVRTQSVAFSEEIDLQAQDLVRQWDVGALFGMGVGYPIGSAGQLGLELRYNPGFRSVFTHAARSASEQPRAFDDPPPLTRVPPSLRHDAITASLSFTTSIGR